jgi:hypothetical protein
MRAGHEPVLAPNGLHYQMSLDDGVGKAVAGPGCWQRSARVFSDGGRTIEGAREGSAAGSR